MDNFLENSLRYTSLLDATVKAMNDGMYIGKTTKRVISLIAMSSVGSTVQLFLNDLDTILNHDGTLNFIFVKSEQDFIARLKDLTVTAYETTYQPFLDSVRSNLNYLNESERDTKFDKAVSNYCSHDLWDLTNIATLNVLKQLADEDHFVDAELAHRTIESYANKLAKDALSRASIIAPEINPILLDNRYKVKLEKNYISITPPKSIKGGRKLAETLDYATNTIKNAPVRFAAR